MCMCTHQSCMVAGKWCQRGCTAVTSKVVAPTCQPDVQEGPHDTSWSTECPHPRGEGAGEGAHPRRVPKRF
jgi:hypothetical protein